MPKKKKLVIVESPTKAKTISRFLGGDYVVESSYGHIRDLPKNKIGVDTTSNFEPEYVVPDKSKKIISKLQGLSKNSDFVYFATDEDREGEAIAWHLQYLLKPQKGKNGRIVFHEITKRAIQDAIENPREINDSLFDAQQARRVLDRLVGYELSPLLWKKIRYGLSAGRVQSVAVRLVVDRENEIDAFKKEEYWTIELDVKKQHSEDQKSDFPFHAKLIKQHGKSIPKLGITSKEQADQIVKELDNSSYIVFDIQKKERRRQAPSPFITSTLQQEAARKFGFSAKQTMVLAQQLYEGLHIGQKGQVGLITYMRTDSLSLSSQFIDNATSFIEKEYGSSYVQKQHRAQKKKSKHAQEAHEAIRPSSVKRTPDSLSSYLDPRQLKLYSLIWQRAVASRMSDAISDATRVDIMNGDYLFRATGSTITFEGFLKVYDPQSNSEKDIILPELQKKEELDLVKLEPLQHLTQPPARYTEATLVKALEENGIGRPSTYAPTINTIQTRKYVDKIEKRFHPTDTGKLVNSVLTKHFPTIVDIKFTAHMEKDLDDIAQGEKEWVPVIQNFYKPFKQNLKKKEKELSKEDLTQEKTDEKCEKCGSDMVIKFGRFGKFMACSAYPTCKNTKPIGEEKDLKKEYSDRTCEKCGSPMAVKHGRFGPFLGCSSYPDCKNIVAIEKKTGAQCPKCSKGDIIEKRSKKGRTFFACNTYPDCDFALWQKPTGKTCPTCKSLLVFAAQGKVKCSEKTCDFIEDNPDSDKN